MFLNVEKENYSIDLCREKSCCCVGEQTQLNLNEEQGVYVYIYICQHRCEILIMFIIELFKIIRDFYIHMVS